MTRIFKVTYMIAERYDGKLIRSCEERKKVTAINASDAIRKVEKIITRGSSFYDEEEKKKVKITYSKFEPIEVRLEAETD